MSQLILDDQLFSLEVLVPLARWITVERLRDLRPGEVIKDERVPEILRSVRQSTFVSIDEGFWNRHLCDSKYCILYFALRDDEQQKLPSLLRRLFSYREFRTKQSRIGKVVRVSTIGVDYWAYGGEKPSHIEWDK